MEVTHRTRSQERSGDGEGLCLLANKKGGYALLGNNEFSHFGGVFHFLPAEWTLFKTVDAILLDRPVSGVVNKYHSVQRFLGDAAEEVFFFGKTLYYRVDGYRGGITIDLDFRRVYDDDDGGRVYKIYWEDGCVVVEYAKGGETFFLVIGGVDKYALLNEWQPRKYPYDAARGGRAERWVYRALRLSCEGTHRLSFTFGFDKPQAMYDAGVAWDDWEVIRSRLKGFAQSVRTSDGVAHSSAVFALESLVVSLNRDVNRTGVYAGYPWFFHFWARDELISLQGLVLAEKYCLAKEVLFRYAHGLLPDGRLPNRVPSADLGSADAAGWLWKRLGDLLRCLERRRLVQQYFSQDELEWLRVRLEDSLRSLRARWVRDGLVQNGALETWMDTHGGTDDVRGGARVEVQALTLASLQTLQLLYRLLRRGNGGEFREFERSLVRRVRECFVMGGVLGDGAGDATVRPNVFLAAYAYPGLLPRKEWLATFDRALERLWLDWGGLSSIDKGHPLFCSSYTGQDDRSYHRGDSWYWVNNVAALVLHRFDKERYAYHVRAIRDASVRDLLWLGVAGHCSEVSSAGEQVAAGCLSQAWSAATLVELLDELGE
ncbi:hypothetical protein JXA12_00795 [Candidatus Woesearchaeota archaeon]|nr:hypothetical protein [Candidatus Woesearchaeota archaeon]